eukprot:TRINITY_DN21313_c0_g1_i2.p1 TRINITY_DN21313_c0_g1~~TRINITY_DN21313_c0_g1_i2.p1  ORF type:complete len:331 (+),score=22.65 TRINITY_DN21313_c0_g1_i2:54-995(+)
MQDDDDEDHNHVTAYSLRGCTCRVGGCGFSFVQKRWLLVHYYGKIFKVEALAYLLWAAVWGGLFFTGWLAFSQSDPNPFAPGQVMFDLCLLVSSAYVFGNILSSLIRLPPLFGYLIIGIAVSNITSTDGIPPHLASIVKELALTVIVARAGLGFPVNTFLGDVKDIRYHTTAGGKVQWMEKGKLSRLADCFRKLKIGLLLAVVPMTLEAAAYAGTAVLIFGFDIIWGCLLGFVMAAVSPAVVVPGLIDLQTRGYTGGTFTSPVPPIVLLASGLDDVFAITLFGLFFGMAFGRGSWAVTAPLEILGGAVSAKSD